MILQPEYFRSIRSKLIGLTNDLRFKYHFSNQLSLVKTVIETVSGEQVEYVKIRNTEVYPSVSDGKNARYDLNFEYGENKIAIFEMENGVWNEANANRFLYYLMAEFNNIVKKGDSEYLMKEVSLFVFLSKKKKDLQGIIENYRLRTEANNYLSNKIHIYLINISCIDEIVKNNDGLSGLDTFHQLIYAMKHGLTDDLLKLKDKEILEMYRLENRYFDIDNGAELAAALRRRYDMMEAARKEKEHRELKQQVKEYKAIIDKFNKSKKNLFAEKKKAEVEMKRAEAERIKAEEEKKKAEEEKKKAELEKNKFIEREDIIMNYLKNKGFDLNDLDEMLKGL